MNLGFFEIKKNQKINKLILIIFFIVIFIFIYNFTLFSAKGILIETALQKGGLAKQFGLWGYIVDKLYNFFNLLLGGSISNITLLNILLALQVASIWSIVIYKITKFLNFYTIIIFFSPFILNYFSVCIRDAIAIGLLLMLIINGFNYIKLALSLLISFFIHKGILPLILTNTIINKLKNRSKMFFLSVTIFSILISIFVHFLLRYTDFASYLPSNFYSHILSFPRYGILGSEQGNVQFFGERNIAYNFYGNFNFKILSFGLIGQIISIVYKNRLNSNIFCLSFAVFFVCSALSTIPNADRLIYHAVLISGPFYLDLFFLQLSKSFKNFKNKNFNLYN